MQISSKTKVVPTCKPDQLPCAEKMKNKIDKSECLHKCEGLYVASYSKTEIVDKAFVTEVFSEYEKYKGYIPYPESLKGLNQFIYHKQIHYMFFRLLMEI